MEIYLHCSSYERALKLISMCLLGLILAVGCSPKTQVVLLPEPDGGVGKVTVSGKKGSQQLDRAWQSTKIAVGQETPEPPEVLGEKRVKEIFGPAISARPEPAKSFMLYFIKGASDLKADSVRLIPDIVRTTGERKSNDISVIGHTDRTGSAEFNMKLSLKRARKVADLLIARGIDPGSIEITSHGEANPLIPTPDNVEEPRNRRVEVTVR